MSLVKGYVPKPVKRTTNFRRTTAKPTAKPVKSMDSVLGTAMVEHLDAINKKSYFPKAEVEEILLRDKKFEIHRMKNRFTTPDGLVKFTPSGASKCRRELFYKFARARQDEIQQAPFNNRWTRNSTAIHGATQRDLLYAPYLLKNPYFKMKMVVKEGFGLLPAWERNIETYKVIEYNGVKFVVSGMMDGLLEVIETGQTVGFEYKTKSNDSNQINKMTKPAQPHIAQVVSYSLVFEDDNGNPVDDYLITYEAVAKDKWDSGDYAVPDVKSFHVKVSQRQKTNMLKKFSEVAQMVYDGEIPERETSKCMFCPFKDICLGGER